MKIFTRYFVGLVTDMEEENDSCPLIKTDECTFAYIKVTTHQSRQQH